MRAARATPQKPPRPGTNRKEIAVNAPFFLAPTASLTGRIAAAAVIGLIAAGCSHQSTAVRYDQVHPIQVSVEPHLIELPAEIALSGFDAARIDAFGRDFLKASADAVTIAYPSDVDAARVVNAAAARLKGVGLDPKQILRGPYARENEGDRGVVLSYYAPAAEPTACPSRLGDSTRDPSNQTPARFGCAFQNNVAAMLEEPRDAVGPRPATPPSADRRFHVLAKYASGDKTASEKSGEKTKTTDE